jgi:cobalt-zinc-cadmium resistance protein CzcA
MALSNRVGAEIQQPIAWVMMGGLITSTMVTLFLVPLFLLMIERAQPHPSLEPLGTRPADPARH